MDLSLAASRTIFKTKVWLYLMIILRTYDIRGMLDVHCKDEKLNFSIGLPERSRDLVYHFGTSLPHFGLMAKL